MDNQARLLAILSELTIDELRLVELFVEWLAAGMPTGELGS
ncbi:hypothetical protein ES703_121383 [subsurface metagenome]